MKRSGLLWVIMVMALSAALASCGGGGGSSSPPAADISGTWSIVSTVGLNNCGDPTGVDEFLTAVISHNGTSNSFSADVYDAFGSPPVSCSGTISGTSIRISNCSYVDGAGVTTSNVSGTLDVGTMTIVGEDNWTWVGSTSCSGKSDWVAMLVGGGGGGQVQITTTESEPNDSIATSNIITGSLPVNISGAYISTDDYYEITFTNSATQTISLTGLSSDIDLRLLNSSGIQLDSSTLSGTASESITYAFTGGVTYYIHVYPFGTPATTNYTLTIN